MVENYKDWLDKPLFALWGYRTSICTSNTMMPHSLVYVMEVMLLIKIAIPSLKVNIESQVLDSE